MTKTFFLIVVLASSAASWLILDLDAPRRRAREELASKAFIEKFGLRAECLGMDWRNRLECSGLTKDDRPVRFRCYPDACEWTP